MEESTDRQTDRDTTLELKFSSVHEDPDRYQFIIPIWTVSYVLLTFDTCGLT